MKSLTEQYLTKFKCCQVCLSVLFASVYVDNVAAIIIDVWDKFQIPRLHKDFDFYEVKF